MLEHISDRAIREGTDINPSLNLIFHLVRLQSMVARRMDTSLGSHHGISSSDLLLLYHLSRGPGGRLRRGELADRLGMTASGVTRLLLPLETLALVERQREPRDARVGYAVITHTGLELMKNALELAAQIAEELLRNCPPADIKALTNTFGGMAGMTAIRF